MRIESVRIARYGCIEGLETVHPLPSIVVVLGPNESGKSTFFSFLTDLLYGFSPASRDRHPRTPWSGSGDPEGRLRMRLDNGTALDLHRRLGSAGQGTLSDGARAEEIRNQPLAAVGHVGRDIFRQVHALTLNELTSLEGQSWVLVQDRLVAALGMKGLRPPRSVADASLAEANRLWRPDRRGKPVARALREEIGALRQERREAAGRDDTLRENTSERHRAENERTELRRSLVHERERRAVLADRLARLQPVRARLARIDELYTRAGPDAEIADLPDDPVSALDELRQRLSDVGIRIEERQHREATLCEAVESYDRSHHPQVLDNAARLEEAAREQGMLKDLESDLDAARTHVDELIARGTAEGESFFTVPWVRVPLEALAGVPRREMLQRIGTYEGAQAAAMTEQENAERPLVIQSGRARQPHALNRIGGIAGIAAGLGLASWPLLWPDFVLPIGGLQLTAAQGGTAAALLGIAGGALLFLHRAATERFGRYQRALADAEQMRAQRIASREKAVAEARAAIVELVQDLSIAPDPLANPDADLVARIGELGELARQIIEGNAEMEARQDAVIQVRTSVREARSWLRTILPEGDAGSDPAEAVQSARSARETRDLAHQSWQREVEQREVDEAGQRAVSDELAVLVDRLAPLAEGEADADRGAEIAAGRMAARERAQALRSELERSHPELTKLEEEIAQAEAEGESWEDLQNRIDARQSRIDTMNARIEELQATIATLASRIDHLSESDTMDAIDGRIAVLEERERRVREERDRAFVLSRLIRTADRRFRDENQPELIVRAERYLRQVTGGRYDHIELGGDDDAFRLRRSPVGAPDTASEDLPLVRVDDRLSQGTREQVYFAIRLAIVGHLDAGHESLPLFMDEAFVNWDAWRRDGALDLLEQLATERQIFVFTCHPAMAAELEDRGAAIVSLPAP